jgi:5-methylthioadenosine/S-adenosylhomocysteine deaminase
VHGTRKWGKSLIRRVHDLGFLDERVMTVHLIWVDDDDLDLLPGPG